MKRQSALVLCVMVFSLAALVAGEPGIAERARAQGAAAPLPIGTEALPSGVSIETVLADMHQPVAMAFDPQGRLFYTEKNTGAVRLFANGVLQPDPVITFVVNSQNEHGLLGLAVDPNFIQNHYLYVYYTCFVGPGCPGLENRVARFVEHNGVGRGGRGRDPRHGRRRAAGRGALRAQHGRAAGRPRPGDRGPPVAPDR